MAPARFARARKPKPETTSAKRPQPERVTHGATEGREPGLVGRAAAVRPAFPISLARLILVARPCGSRDSAYWYFSPNITDFRRHITPSFEGTAEEPSTQAHLTQWG